MFYKTYVKNFGHCIINEIYVQITYILVDTVKVQIKLFIALMYYAISVFQTVFNIKLKSKSTMNIKINLMI